MKIYNVGDDALPLSTQLRLPWFLIRRQLSEFLILLSSPFFSSLKDLRESYEILSYSKFLALVTHSG
eukprot:3630511-Amphidinium_carterae.1